MLSFRDLLDCGHRIISDTVKTIAAITLILVALPFLILWVRDRRTTALRYRDHPPEQLVAERAAYLERILQPDWALVERYLHRSAPSTLRELYAAGALVTAQDLKYTNDEAISTFEALDHQGVRDAKALLGFDALVIATTDCGDPVYLRVGPAEADTVYVTRHDGGDTEVFAGSVRQMLDVLRDRNRSPRSGAAE